MEFSGFAKFPIVDGHVHFIHPESLDEVVTLFDQIGYARANLVCLPNPDGTNQNAAALHFKERYPKRVYLSGALAYGPALADPTHAPEMLARQVAALKAQGFDGLKLIEGKPEVRKLLPYPLDGPLYAELWAALEQEQFPVVFHVADPDEFWDAERCPAWARKSGWDYSDGSYPTKESLYTEVDHILERHPRLKLTLAHFYFLSRELPRAARFLDAHPGVCFDLTPHVDMYADFSRAPAAARDFFLRYQERIIYGTDLDTRVLRRGASGKQFILHLAWLIRAFLEQAGPFVVPDASDDVERYHGLGLPREVLEKIYYRNFERVVARTIYR
ncbi:MAG TPA: amidohydrolase family protein [Anaerolineae bacterium]|nr:amidohydrolase family protein [Anaerolineae bacterium]HQI85595.1 amidohydrolase family protein [Anaerolineae bacterium]